MSPSVDYSARLAKLRHQMAQQDAAAFICDHGEMLAWLTGYSVSETRYRACIVPAEGHPIWVLRSIDQAPCRRASWVNDVRVFADHQDPFATIAEVINELGLDRQRLAADYTSYGFTVHTFECLRQQLPDTQWVNLAAVSDQLRAIKDRSEIAQLKRAASIADGAMTTLLEQLKPGMRPRDAAAIAAAYYLQHGADDWWVGPIAISRRANTRPADIDFLHQALIDETLQTGDVLHVELVPRVNNYSARMMRSIVIGTTGDSSLSRLMTTLVALQDRQIDLLRPGAHSADVDRALRQPVLKQQLRADFANATGYQIGLYTKTPRSSDFSYCFQPGASWTVQAGMTFHMYLSAQGLSISDSIVVGIEEPIRLTQTERGLLSTCRSD